MNIHDVYLLTTISRTLTVGRCTHNVILNLFLILELNADLATESWHGLIKHNSLCNIFDILKMYLDLEILCNSGVPLLDLFGLDK